MRIPPELIDQVRSEVNILDVVSQKCSCTSLGKIGSAFVLSIRKRHHRFRLMNKNKFLIVSRVIGAEMFLSS